METTSLQTSRLSRYCDLNTLSFAIILIFVKVLIEALLLFAIFPIDNFDSAHYGFGIYQDVLISYSEFFYYLLIVSILGIPLFDGPALIAYLVRTKRMKGNIKILLSTVFWEIIIFLFTLVFIYICLRVSWDIRGV